MITTNMHSIVKVVYNINKGHNYLHSPGITATAFPTERSGRLPNEQIATRDWWN